MSAPFIHPMDKIDLGIARAVKGMMGQDPATSYLTDSRQSVDKTMRKIQDIKATIHPLALQFLNTQMTYQPVAIGAYKLVSEPIQIVLLELNNRFFGYVDVMQDYIELMKLGFGDLPKFVEFVTHICRLAREYKHEGRMLMTKEKLLDELSMIDEQGNNSRSQSVIANAGTPQQSSFLEKLLARIKEHVRIYDSPNGSHDTLLIVCRHLREQVVPMLQVLTGMNDDAFIRQLDLKMLISQLKEIGKLEKSLKDAELRVQIDAETRKEMIGDFGTKFVPKRGYSDDEQAFVDSGNASQSVIGNSTFSAKGGRRSRRHKKRSGKSGNKRSGKSGNKRSGKRSDHNKRSGHKRSGHKSRRR
jgi:hypothetical protein